MAANIIEKQERVIHLFSSTIGDYERNKASIETQFQREKETIESNLGNTTAAAENDLNSTMTTAERNRSNTTNEAERVITSIRESMRSAQNTINQHKWQNKLQGGTPTHLALAAGTSIGDQLRAYRVRAEEASHEIRGAADEYDRNRIKTSNVTSSQWRNLPGSIRLRIWGIYISVYIISCIIIFGILINNYSNYSIVSDIAGALFASIWPAAIIGGIIAISFLPYIHNKSILKKLLSKDTYATLLEDASIAEDLYKQRIAIVQQTYEQQVETAKRLHQQQMATAQQAYQRESAESQARYAEQTKTLQQTLVRNVAEIRSSSGALLSEVGLSVVNWNNPQWQQWQPVTTHMPIVRLGMLSTSVHQDIPTIPAFVACPGNQNILFKAGGAAKSVTIDAIQSLMLRLLATQPPGKVEFTLIDPVGIGDNVSRFMVLADYNDDLVGSKAWSETRDIDKQLADLSEQMSVIIQKYLRGQYKTIEEYNQQAGEIAEPYRILVVIGFPVKFSQEASTRLVEIATNGPKCGVSTIVMWDIEQTPPYGFNADDLERVSTVISWEGQRFVWKAAANESNKDIEKCQLTLDTPPPLELFNQILEKVGQAAKNMSDVKVPFERTAPQREGWWTSSTRQYLSVPLGRAGARKLQYLDLGKGTSQHALVVGKTGSGKTTLLHVLIANLALTYSPDELELYLVDFKTVGFTPYATHTLPHARVVAIQSEREFGLSVLQGLDAELERRKNIFSKAGVQDIAQYRGVQPGVRMPRLLLLVDEFQEFFTQDDKIAQEATLLFDRLVRQGRAFGIHVMLGSQTLAGSYTLARPTIGQMAVRIALQCEESDSRLVLSDENPAARLLSRPGEAIYNDKNGLVEGNSPFQCSWLSDDELDTYLEDIRTFARQKRYTLVWKQVIFDGSKEADIAENTLLIDTIRASSWTTPQKIVPAWVGDPIAIKDPTAVQLRPQDGCNILVIGQQEETALGVLIAALLSLTAQYAPGGARFYVADFSPADTTYAGLLKSMGEALPHGVKVVNRRGILQVVTELSDEVQDRTESEGAKKAPIFFFIYGLQRARDLRPDEDFGFSSFGSDAAEKPNPSKQFSLILRQGPEAGVHTLAWCDTLTNLNRSLERGLLREFEQRIAFQMSQEDSMSFIDSPAASKLGPHRALLFSEETGRAEKFRPYGLPSENWLQQAVKAIGLKK